MKDRIGASVNAASEARKHGLIYRWRASIIGALCENLPVQELTRIYNNVYKTDVPAKEAASFARAWLPGAYGNQGWSQGVEGASCCGSSSVDGDTEPRQAHQLECVVRSSMMWRRYRLRQEDDFKRVREVGRAYHHPWLILSVAPGRWPHNRYGFITPKRLGKAVHRNRLRRQLREACRLLQLQGQLRQGFDVVVIGRPAGMAQTFAALQTTLLTLCAQAGLIMQKDDTAC
jgi:ribonuclease P protein component